MTVGKASLAEILQLSRDEVTVQPTLPYETAGVRSYGRGLFARPSIIGAETAYSKLYRLHTDQVVLSRLFAWEGAVAMVPSEFDGHFVSSEFPTFDVDLGMASPSYVGHFLSRPTFHDQLAGETRGLGQRRQRVHVENFLALQIPLPPLETQRKIAFELDTWRNQAEHLRSIVGSNPSESILKKLPSFADAAIRAVSTRTGRVGDVVEFISDTVHPGDAPGPAAEFVGLQHVESHTGRQLGSDPLGSEKGRKFRFQPGDIVYGYLRPYLNKVWLADRHGLCSVDQYVLRTRAGFAPDLLAHTLRSVTVLSAAIDLTHSLQLPRLRSGLLANIQIPVPSGTSTHLVAQLDRIRDMTMAAAHLRRRQQAAVAALIPAALNEAFAGLM